MFKKFEDFIAGANVKVSCHNCHNMFESSEMKKLKTVEVTDTLVIEKNTMLCKSCLRENNLEELGI